MSKNSRSQIRVRANKMSTELVELISEEIDRSPTKAQAIRNIIAEALNLKEVTDKVELQDSNYKKLAMAKAAPRMFAYPTASVEPAKPSNNFGGFDQDAKSLVAQLDENIDDLFDF